MNADESIAYHFALKGKKSMPVFQTEAEKEEFIINEICPVLKKTAAGDFPVIVIKLGERGALAIYRGEIFHEETQAINACSTVGAGDVFSAAFLKEFLAGKSIAECLQSGNKFAFDYILKHGGK